MEETPALTTHLAEPLLQAVPATEKAAPGLLGMSHCF